MTTRTRPQPRRKVRPTKPANANKPANKPKRTTQKLVPRGGIRVDEVVAHQVHPSLVAERVKSRKRLDEVQREIEDLTREVEQVDTLLEKVTLRKKLAMKEEERQKLYEMMHLVNTGPANMNTFEKAITLRERRARNKETQKLKTKMQDLLTRSPVRVMLPTLKMKNRMAINRVRLDDIKTKKIQNEFKRAIRFKEDERTKEAREKEAEDDAEAERMLKRTQTKWVNPELKKAKEEQSALETQQKLFFEAHKEDSEMPSELLNMMVNANTRKSMPVPSNLLNMAVKKTRKAMPRPKIRKR